MSDLNLRRRHVVTCSVGAAETINQCQCPLYVDGRDDSGKRVRRGLGTRNMARALEKIRQWSGDPATAARALAADRNLKDCAHTFCEDPDRDVSETTRAMYRHRLDHFRGYVERRGVSSVSGINEPLVRDYLDTLPGRGGAKRKTSSRKLAMVHLKTFTAYCAKRQWIAADPLASLELKGGGQISGPYIPKPFTLGEVERLLGAAEIAVNSYSPTRMKALLSVFLYTGLRLIDVTLLKWSDIDLNTGHFWVRSTEKTDEPFIVIAHAEMIAALKAWQKECPNRVTIFMNGSVKGTKVGIDRALRRLGKRAKVERVHAHRFRDTFACRALTTGADIRTVQHLLGHKSVTTTERHYTRWIREHQALANAAVAALDFHSSASNLLPVDSLGDTDGNSQDAPRAPRRRSA